MLSPSLIILSLMEIMIIIPVFMFMEFLKRRFPEGETK